MPSEPVILGRISGLFGVRGWVKVFSYTEPREAVLKYENVLLRRDGNWRDARIAQGQRHGKSVIARIDGIGDRDAAAELIGVDIGINRDALPDPDAGQFYWTDLIGLVVRQKDGVEIGRIDAMLETGANDVMVVKGERERLIPFVMGKFVVGVDLAKGVVDVDWEWD